MIGDAPERRQTRREPEAAEHVEAQSSRDTGGTGETAKIGVIFGTEDWR